MNDAPFFSVVIPVHNVGRYLRESLGSLAAQTFGDWEAVCVDDGSADDSLRILQRYTAEDGRFRVVRQRQSGVSAARNKALAVAHGRYVAFLDADDALDARWLEIAHDRICETKPDLLRMDFLFWRENEEIPHSGGDGKAYSVPGKDVYAWGWENFLLSGHLWRCFILRERLDGLEFQRGLSVREDCIFLLNVLPRLRIVSSVGFAGYYYRLRRTSACHVERRVEDAVLFPAECFALWSRQKGLFKMNDGVGRMYSIALLNNVTEWVDFSGRNKNPSNDAKVAAATIAAMEAEAFSPKQLQCKWRLSFWWLSKTGRIGLFRLVAVCTKPAMAFRAMLKRIWNSTRTSARTWFATRKSISTRI